MAEFSLADAILDDAPSQPSSNRNSNTSVAYNGSPHPTNPGWPGAAPGGPSFPPSGGPAQPSAPGGFPHSGPGAPGSFPHGPGAPGHYPNAPSAPAGYPPGSGMPPQFPSNPGQFPPGGAPMPYSGGQFPSTPGAPQGPYPNAPYPAGPPGPPTSGMYGPGGPPAFPPAPVPGHGFAGGAFPPVPPGSWGVPGGGFPPHSGPPGGFGPGPMGPYGGPGAPGGTMPVPYDLPLHAGLVPRLLITIVGEPVLGGERFHVDFVKGSDVVFHFNPRFTEQTVVRNSNLGGYWGPEERDGGFPFVPGRQFELKILVETDMFKVAVDGVHLLEFEHRVGGMEEVTLLRVVGDVTLYSVAPTMI
ncbi:galectin-3 isoform X1 [Brachyhypopomus gauderio]|uniref:galectin-3 isoform X1 n=1 Tax=Brachyhypopomus gauderio TaxID=698409 RepID=UPI0040427D63